MEPTFFLFTLNVLRGGKQRCEFNSILFIPASQGEEDGDVFVNVV